MFIRRPDKFCGICKVIARKDVETEHCTFCDYCVEGLDHHCPWSSKCIGRGNMLAFKTFLAGVGMSFIYAFLGGLLVASATSDDDSAGGQNLL